MDKKLMFYQKDLGRSSLQRPRTQHPPPTISKLWFFNMLWIWPPLDGLSNKNRLF